MLCPNPPIRYLAPIKRKRGRPKGSVGSNAIKRLVTLLDERVQKNKEREKISFKIKKAKIEQAIERQKEQAVLVSLVISLRKQNFTYETISRHTNVTRERVRQILKKHAPELTGPCEAIDPTRIAECEQKHKMLLDKVKKMAVQTDFNLTTMADDLGYNQTTSVSVLIREIRKIDPEFAKLHDENKRRRNKIHLQNMWKKPGYAEKVMQARKESNHYEKMGKRMKRLWSDPEWKKKSLESRNKSDKYKNRNKYSTLSAEESRKRMFTIWNDPEKRKERLELIRAGLQERIKKVKEQNESNKSNNPSMAQSSQTSK